VRDIDVHIASSDGLGAEPHALRITLGEALADIADKIPARITAVSCRFAARPESDIVATRHTGRSRWWDLRPDSTA